ncbi:MAG: hypothetical protein M3Q23_09285 [Actinomycetota bacterium]|nr:hypothetical protein [Actinomycetota bacterium]
MPHHEDEQERRCPVCGQGVLQHLGTESGRRLQRPESPIIETYTCGHEVTEPSLATSDADRLEVERRTSQDTVDPPSAGAE